MLTNQQLKDLCKAFIQLALDQTTLLSLRDNMHFIFFVNSRTWLSVREYTASIDIGSRCRYVFLRIGVSIA